RLAELLRLFCHHTPSPGRLSMPIFSKKLQFLLILQTKHRIAKSSAANIGERSAIIPPLSKGRAQ
ncbi:MAG: hypothetical protein Q4C65_14540, partial [Eubacteriales bacterium]|nr:hypothetical protein [Eubacteriales bacterium]